MEDVQEERANPDVYDKADTRSDTGAEAADTSTTEEKAADDVTHAESGFKGAADATETTRTPSAEESTREAAASAREAGIGDGEGAVSLSTEAGKAPDIPVLSGESQDAMHAEIGELVDAAADNRTVFQDDDYIYGVSQIQTVPNTDDIQHTDSVTADMLHEYFADHDITGYDAETLADAAETIESPGSESWRMIRIPKGELQIPESALQVEQITDTAQLQSFETGQSTTEKLADITLADIANSDTADIEGVVQGSAAELQELMNTHPDMLDGTWSLDENGLLQRDMDRFNGRYIVNEAGDLIYSGDSDTPPQILSSDATSWQEIPEESLPEELQPYTDGADNAAAASQEVSAATRQAPTPEAFARRLADANYQQYNYLNSYLQNSLEHLQNTADNAADPRITSEQIGALMERMQDQERTPLEMLSTSDGSQKAALLEMLDESTQSYENYLMQQEGKALDQLDVKEELLDIFNSRVDEALAQNSAQQNVDAAIENL
jgi:hypothetical protein